VCIKAFRSLTVRARGTGVHGAAARLAIGFAAGVPLYLHKRRADRHTTAPEEAAECRARSDRGAERRRTRRIGVQAGKHSLSHGGESGASLGTANAT